MFPCGAVTREAAPRDTVQPAERILDLFPAASGLLERIEAAIAERTFAAGRRPQLFALCKPARPRVERCRATLAAVVSDACCSRLGGCMRSTDFRQAIPAFSAAGIGLGGGPGPSTSPGAPWAGTGD